MARANVHLAQIESGAADIALPLLSSAREPLVNADRETLCLLAATVRAIAPRHVIEFGCGASTELLAQLGFEHGRMAVTCFEHDPWAAAELIASSGSQAITYRWFSFCICPLVARSCGDRLLPVYDDRMTLPTVPYPADLIVINGPPDVLGGRAGMMYQALKYARPGSTVLVMDVRTGEEAIFEDWLCDLAAHLEFVPPGFLHRHLAFVVRSPMTDAFSLEAPFAQERAMRANEALVRQDVT